MSSPLALLQCALQRFAPQNRASLNSVRRNKNLITAIALSCIITMSATANAKNKDDKTGANNSGWSASISKALENTTLTTHQKKLVIKINNYLNQLNNIKGRFLQINPDDGKQKGKFYLKRPGRIRFDYSPPSLQVVVSNGKYLSIEDRDINSVDRFPLENTPFRILLAKEVNIVRDAVIKAVIETDERTSIILNDRKGGAIGQIELIFVRDPIFELKEWKVIDAQGQTTRVILSNLKFEEKIDGKLFTLEQNIDPFFNP